MRPNDIRPLDDEEFKTDENRWYERLKAKTTLCEDRMVPVPVEDLRAMLDEIDAFRRDS